MKITFITTVYNEKKTITDLLDSVFFQTKLPDEIIVVDGGSTDATVAKVTAYKVKRNFPKIKLTIKKGNRSVGRNEAIKLAKNEIIVCSDSGNILDKNWIKNITRSLSNKRVDVVAGYYKGKAETTFQKAVIPYVLVMEDKVDPENFLPATRSIAFKKSIWKKIEGFKEIYSHNEDYVFARDLKNAGANIVFAKDAIVYWMPRNNFKQTFTMMWRFAYGDAEAQIFRTKVLLIFARYFLGFYFILLCALYRSIPGLSVALILLVIYISWSIKKNYRYINQKEAYYLLPLLQFTADAAVSTGTAMGFLKRFKTFNYFSYMRNNKLLFTVIAVYCTVILTTLQWGIPNRYHPFPYHMDEWHQLQAVANTFRYGTPNTFGSANGTLFHFLLSGIYLIPFTIFQIIDPFSLQIDNWIMRERVFEVLRLQTMLFGILSIFTLYRMSKLLKISTHLTLILFTFTPIWLMLSGYFKYDIALMFWIILSLYFFLRFAKDSTTKNFMLASIPASLAIAVKVSAAPLFLIYILLYFMFYPSWKKHFKQLAIGILLFISCIIIFGLPDTLFNKGNVLLYLNENIIQSPAMTSNFNLNMDPYQYLIFHHYPIIFGYGLCILFVVAILFWVYLLFRNIISKSLYINKIVLFTFLSFALFAISLIPLQIWAAGNRSLVLLPFFVLIVGLAYQRYKTIFGTNILLYIFIGIMILFQLFISAAWVDTRYAESPQVASSEWIRKNLPKGQTIGIENIPIYQQLPDILQKEFYFDQYKIKQNNLFTYVVIDEKTKKLPYIIVLTNADINKTLLKESSQKKLLRRLEEEKFKKIAVFSPKLTYLYTFINDQDYYFSALLASPRTITVYRKP